MSNNPVRAKPAEPPYTDPHSVERLTEYLETQFHRHEIPPTQCPNWFYDEFVGRIDPVRWLTARDEKGPVLAFLRDARTTSISVGHPTNDLEKNINDFDRMTMDDDCSSVDSVDVEIEDNDISCIDPHGSASRGAESATEDDEKVRTSVSSKDEEDGVLAIDKKGKGKALPALHTEIDFEVRDTRECDDRPQR